MLRVNHSLSDTNSAVFSEAEEALRLIIKTFRRRKFLILSMALIGAGLAAAYAAAVTPLYTAKALLLIDSQQARALSINALSADMMDSSRIDSQVEILKSEGIAKSVIAYLEKIGQRSDAVEVAATGGGGSAAAVPALVAPRRSGAVAPPAAVAQLSASGKPGMPGAQAVVPTMAHDGMAGGGAAPQGNASPRQSADAPAAGDQDGGWSLNSLLAFIFPTIFGTDDVSSAYKLERHKIESFSRNLDVSRLARSFVISIGFTSPDRELAALTANQVAEAYIVDQLESKYQATRRASVWLQDRISELRDQALKADRAVQDFKAKHDIVSTSQGLVSEQQLSEVNSQLIKARAQIAEAKARYERVKEILAENNARGVSEEVVSDVLHNTVITSLRSKYLDAEKRYEEWSRKYGPDHAAVVNLRIEMGGIQRALFNELGRIAETYKSELEIARAQEASLSKEVAALISQAKINNQAQVELRELESGAQSYRALYDNFLQRYMQATQEQSFPITEARVITEATAALKPSSPRTKLIVAMGLMGGFLLGVGVGLMRERMDRTFRLPEDVDRYLGLESLGVLSSFPTTVATQVSGGSAFEGNMSGPLRWAVSDPFSHYAEVLRAVKVAADVSLIDRGCKVIGIVSTLPKEGKSTISCNLAQLIAHSGAPCILVDADLRNPSLTRQLAPKAQAGLLELTLGSATIDQVSIVDPVTNLRFVPAVVPRSLVHSNDVLASAMMSKVVDELRTQATYVVVDLPPLAPVSDVLASTHLIDCFVYVLEWGTIRRELVIDTLRKNPEVYKKILGCLINKVDLATLRSLEDYGGKHYYYKYQVSYGRHN